MATINEAKRLSDVLLFEEGEDFNYCREAITLASGTAASVIGQVLGKVTIGAATVTAKVGNTGTGALTMDATTPILANAQVGRYIVRCTAAASNAGTMTVFSPKGSNLGTHTVAGAAFANQIKFAVADATDFVVGDEIYVDVAEGSGEYGQVTPGGVDGKAVAAAVLLEAKDASGGALTAVALVRGPAIVKESGLVWTSGMSAGEKTTAKAQLAALGIPNRGAYGV